MSSLMNGTYMNSTTGNIAWRIQKFVKIERDLYLNARMVSIVHVLESRSRFQECVEFKVRFDFQ